jgi:hypothetical protein
VRQQKRFGILMAAGLALAGSACSSDTSPPTMSSADRAATREVGDSAPLTFATRPPSAVQGNVVTLHLAVRGVGLVPADGDTSGRTSHLHVFVDRPAPPPGAAIPKEPGIIHTTDTRVAIDGLSVGDHRFSVVLGDGAHRRIGDAIAETTATVKGPSVTLSTPPTVAKGEPATITMNVEGLDLKAADGDRSGNTGHLHLFVDRPPTPAGQAIPKEDGIIHSTDTAVPLSGLAPGEHTVWVVLGDGIHMPLTPSAMAKSTFVVQG